MTTKQNHYNFKKEDGAFAFNNNGSSATAPTEQQISLPQASSSTSSDQKEEKPQSLKIKFTLSTLSRKFDDDEKEDTIEDNGGSEESGDGGTTTANNTDADSEAPSTTVSLDQVSNHNMKDDVEMESNQNEDATMEENDGESLESSSILMNNENASNDDGGEKLNGFNDENEGTNDPDGENSAAEDDKDDEVDRDSGVDEDDKNAAGLEAHSRPNRRKSSFEKEASNENDRNKASKDDRANKEDASLDTENVNDSNGNKGYSTTSRSVLTNAEREILGFREPPSSTTNLTSSFLDALSEDQRRVRTRHLPNITGFRRLHKGEIKRDVALIKKMLKSAVSKGGGRNEAVDELSNNEAESMEIDENGTQASDDETPSEEEKVENEPTFNEADPDLYNVFSLPYIQSPYICTDIDTKYSTQAADEPALFSSPQVVESITAFNPPRPPESVGPKKMHRLHRWERNPEDVEIDLENYRKTVNRTRQELHKTELERESVEIIGAHLRSHFMAQLQCMRQEMKLLNQQYEETQVKCVKAAELLTSKTRSRGLAKGSYIMKDVISVLKSRGQKLNFSVTEGAHFNNKPWCTAGFGGITYQDGATKLGCGWLLPGDKVSSPSGIGVVDKVYGPSIFDSTDQNTAQSGVKPPQSQLPKSLDKYKSMISTLSPRVRVKLPFGVGFFNPNALTLIESSESFSDNKLSSRWIAVIESAKSMGTSMDSKSFDNQRLNCHTTNESKNDKAEDAEEDDLTESSTLPDASNMEMDIDDTSTVPVITSSTKNDEMVSFSAAIMPLCCNKVSDTDLPQMEKQVERLLHGSSGIVGVVSALF